MKKDIKKKLTFDKELLITVLIITALPLIVSYTNILFYRLDDTKFRIENSLKEVGQYISDNELVQKKLSKRENDLEIQRYTKSIIENFKDIDIIVIGDMIGEKYSHLDESQIGQIFIGEDKYNVLNYGESYYSEMEGSMGKTLRWFQPIVYDGQQVGFIMVGKYYKDIVVINSKIKISYSIQFVAILIISALASKVLARKVKKAMNNMEPYEISRLYKEKEVIINSVNSGIIALNKNNEITEINKDCYRLIEEFNEEKVLSKLSKYIQLHEEFELKEFIIQGKKIFITMKTITKGSEYLGCVITLTDKNNINKIAKEITGVDQVIKNLRANVHEFKNNLYVILGLLQLKKYNEAEEYILKIRDIQKSSSAKFTNIDDYYVKALLLSRELVAKERKIELILTEESFLYESHKLVDSLDIVTILGNLIENSFEACLLKDVEKKYVEVSLFEDEDIIELQVKDNGKEISDSIKGKMFIEGESSKGNSRGTGLFLVKNRVDLYNGSIEIDEFRNEKVFVITISKGEDE